MSIAHDQNSRDAAVGIVSGSGLDLREVLDCAGEPIPFAQYPGLESRALEGHPRTFRTGASGAQRVVLQSGRFHFYEGLDYASVTRPVDLMHEWGIRTIIFTNVCGALRPELEPGALVAVDRLRTWPFVRWPARPESMDTDFKIPGCDFSGTYFWMHGPSYETPAEIRLLQQWGATVVGMSTAPEVQRCHELGIRTAVVSCVTNNCCRPQVLTHEHVVEVARRASGRLVTLLRHALGAGAVRPG